MAGGKKGERLLNLGARLRYPIMITKLYRSPGDKVKRGEPVLQYSFEYLMNLKNKDLEDEETRLSNITDWDAPEDCQLLAWHLKSGDTITHDVPCITVEEACSHEVQFQGLCALCGKDMNEVNWASEHRDTERAPINMTHDQTSLTVSRVAAAKVEHELQKRLLKQRKLSLVVDLDQTIIHACIEPTIGEWQRDPTSRNYDAVKEVKNFQLDDGPRGLTSGCWYYIKMRPGLLEFLSKIAEMYELHVYTMGTRAYAMNIAKIVDPDQKLFANRVISRDENGSMTAKSLQRLFPVSTNMVVIIDDRADVWPRNRPNLIKVTPYDFFKGIGDINSSFLPKREDLIQVAPQGTTVNGAAKPLVLNGAANGDGEAKVSALEELASMGVGENPILLKKQAEEQERSLEKQITDRPLLHMQEQLDKEDEEASSTVDSDSPAEGDQPIQPHPQTRHHLLLDDDHELSYLEKHLTKLHEAFFEEFDARCSTQSQSGRSSSWDDSINMSLVPDVGNVLDRLKFKVLRGTNIVLSGLVPLGVDVRRSEIGLQAASFGAQLQTRVSSKVTHLVISSDRPRTQKVRQAAKIPGIKIVNQNWLADCLSQWALLDETPYLIEIHPADRARLSATATPNENTDAETISDIDTDDNTTTRRNGGTRLKIIVSGPPEVVGDDEAEDSDDEDEGELEDPDDRSPIDDLKDFNWGSADQELADFLAEDDDDEDGDDDGEDRELQMDDDEGESDAPPSGKKRKLDEDTESDRNSSSRGDAVTVKKQRLAKGRSASGLRAARTPESGGGENGSLPTPQVTGDEEDILLLKTSKASQERVDDIDDDELEGELMAELEAEEALAENG